MRIIQFKHPKGGRCLGVVRGQQAGGVAKAQVYNLTEQNSSLNSVYVAFREARRSGKRLEVYLQEAMDAAPSPPAPLPPGERGEADGPRMNYAKLLEAGDVLAPVSEESDLAPSTRLLVSGTGLTHTGSVQQRDQMHKKEESDAG